MARNRMVTAFGKSIRTRSHAPFMIVIRYQMTGVVSVYGYENSERMALQRVNRAKARAGEIADFEIVRLR